MSKPSTADGYSPSQTAHVRATCVYVATKLGDLMDEVVVVGGLVPYLLVDQEDLPAGSDAHAGTMDLDMGLALAILNGERYRDLGNRLRDAGFEASVNEAGNRTSQTWIAPGPPRVKVDFLIPPDENAPVPNRVFHLESDFAAIVTPGLDLAFTDRRERELCGQVASGAQVTRSVPVCGPGAYTVLKALAFGNRAEPKDAYDLFYVWRGVGLPEVVACLDALRASRSVKVALSVIERDFCAHDGLGPVETARFVTGGLDDEVQADVVGYAQEFLRLMGRLGR